MFENIDLYGATYYLHEPKIDDAYGKVAGEVVEKIISQEKEISGKNVKSETSLGNFLNYLGLNLGIEAGLNKENVKSTEVIKKLSYENKLSITLNAMEKVGKCCDIKSLRQDQNPTKYIYFEGDADFCLIEGKPEQFLVKGKVEKYKFKSYCSIEHIKSASIRDFLKEGGTFKIFCAGYIMRQRENNLDLTLYYIGGP